MQVNYIEQKAFEIYVDDVVIGQLILNEDNKIEVFNIYSDLLSSEEDFKQLKAVLNRIDELVKEGIWKWTLP